MHQHLWPHYAASQDGDRKTANGQAGPNSDYYSYETHNDWLQLLEELRRNGMVSFSRSRKVSRIAYGMRRGVANIRFWFGTAPSVCIPFARRFNLRSATHGFLAALVATGIRLRCPSPFKLLGSSEHDNIVIQ